MATNTKNYNLQKDDYEDDYDVGVVNKNLDIIDEKLKEIETEAKNKDFAGYAWDANKLNGKPYENYVTNRVYGKDEDLNNPAFDKAYITFSNSKNVVPGIDASVTGYWHILFFPYVNSSDNNYSFGTQLALPFGKNDLYMRSASNGSWSDWIRVGNNADTLGGKTAGDFAQFKCFENINEMRESEFEGAFAINGDYSRTISGYSFFTNKSQDITPDETYYIDCYMRIYFNNNDWYIATDYYNDDFGTWEHKDCKKVEYQGHKHTKEDITDFPTSIKADGGNADTLGGKTAGDFAEASHSHSEYATKDHTHDDYVKTSSVIAIANGGTGATTASAARSNLGLGMASTKSYSTGVSSGSSALVTSGAVYSALQGYLKTTDNINANTLGGKTASNFAPSGFGLGTSAEMISGTDLNNIIGTGFFRGSNLINSPSNDNDKNSIAYGFSNEYWWFIEQFYHDNFYKRQIAYCLNSGGFDKYNTVLYTRFCDNGNWSNWCKVTGDANAVNKVTKGFTVKSGSWFRFAKCKNVLASGVFVLEVGPNGSCSSISTFSVSQAYSTVNAAQGKILKLSHSSFNTCVTKIRLDTKYGSGVEQYIDFYLENGSDDSTGYVTIQFFGQGWEICDIVSSNIDEGYTQTELEL